MCAGSAFLFITMQENDKKIIAIDAMSGDKGPHAVFGGMNQYLYQNGEDKVLFRVFGDKRALRKLTAKYPRVARNCEIIDAPDVIRGTDKIRDVLRHAQNTSMYMAIRGTRQGATNCPSIPTTSIVVVLTDGKL